MAGFGLGKVNEFAQRFDRNVVVDGNDQRHRTEVPHGHKSGVLVIGQLLHEVLQRRVGAVGADQNRVAIGHRLGSGVCPKHAIDTCPVFNNDGLAEGFRHLGCKSAPDLVCGAAGSKRHDGLDGFVGKRLRRRAHDPDRNRCNQKIFE